METSIARQWNEGTFHIYFLHQHMLPFFLLLVFHKNSDIYKTHEINRISCMIVIKKCTKNWKIAVNKSKMLKI